MFFLDMSDLMRYHGIQFFGCQYGDKAFGYQEISEASGKAHYPRSEHFSFKHRPCHDVAAPELGLSAKRFNAISDRPCQGTAFPEELH